eukprot:8095642-Alexandrium_andersonii.AAC.1
MAKPELAGEGFGLELWHLLIREHEAPEQPAGQREFQKRWAYPKRNKDACGSPSSPRVRTCPGARRRRKSGARSSARAPPCG